MNILQLSADTTRRKYGMRPYKDKIRFQLAFNSTGAYDLITNAPVTISHPTQITLDTTKKMVGEAGSLKFSGQDGTSATLPNNVSYLPGSGDFTYEAVFDFSSIKHQPADNSYLIPLLSWQTWSAPGQLRNLDVCYLTNSTRTSGRLFFGGVSINTPAATVNCPPLTANSTIHLAVVRKSGNVSFYINGTRISVPASWTVDLVNSVVRPVRLGQRLGGGSGNVYWQLVGNILGMRIIHQAIYEGETFQVPTTFR